jgi:chloride channel protein, CIC family
MESQKINQHQAHAITMIAFAASVGILGGLSTILFRKLVAFIHNAFFLGHFSFIYNENFHTSASSWGIGIIFVPMIGGLIVIWLLKKFASDQRGLSVPEIMYAIFCKEGRIQPSIALAKTLSAAITIGTGGSVGREGPVIQIGATLSSIVSDFTHLSAQQRKVLMAAGAAACAAVIFHAPLSGIVFAIELLLVQISVFAILLIIISTILAITIEYVLVSTTPIFSLQLMNQINDPITL